MLFNMSTFPICHCEEQSDEAISEFSRFAQNRLCNFKTRFPLKFSLSQEMRLLRYARNDKNEKIHSGSNLKALYEIGH